MGRYLTDLADVLRAAGLDVVEIAGWRTRGYKHHTTPDGGLQAVDGILVHHTATSAAAAGDYPSVRIVRDGREDVGGPLSQLGLGRSGTWYVIAAGRANHSGAVDDARYSNPRCLGIEAEHPGGAAEWPAEQYASYVRGVAALRAHYDTAPPRGHKEAATPYGRKPDPNFDMAAFRVQVAADELALLDPTTNREDTPTMSFITKDPGRDEHYVTDGVTKRYLSDPKVLAELRKNDDGNLGGGLPVRLMAQYTIDRIPDELTTVPRPDTLTAAELQDAIKAALANVQLPEPVATVDEDELATALAARLVEGLAIEVKAGGAS